MLKKLLLSLAALCAGIANAQMRLVYDINTANTTIQLPLYGTVNVTVDWGDGTPLQNFTNAGARSHTYANVGIDTVVITGSLSLFGTPTDVFCEPPMLLK